MEKRLHDEYKYLRKQGLKVKSCWFRAKAKELLSIICPDAKFAFSEAWFTRFKDRFGISLRRATNVCQRPPEDKVAAILTFHEAIRELAIEGEQKGPQGKWSLEQIANVDQTPLPFCFTDGPTYADRGEKSVWVRSGASGLEKRQCTLTIFADGVARVKPLVIFRGKGKRIPLSETVRYDPRVRVTFQANAWCDEVVMTGWAQGQWQPVCGHQIMLVANVHKAQKTDAVLYILRGCNTEVVFVPPDATSLVQPIDVVFNAPFKAAIDKLATAHRNENVEAYVRGAMNAVQRRVLLTKWVAQAWEEVSSKKEMIIGSFKKWGISVAIDSSEDDQISIEGLPGYTVEDDVEKDSSSDSDDDPFMDEL